MAKVCASTIIAASIDQVWHVLRDFNGHDRWHPAVATSRLEDDQPVDMIGAVRRFELTDGAELREQLLSMSDADHCFQYCILSSPIPLLGYVASVRLKSVTDIGHTFWEWSSEFQTPPGREAELKALVLDGIYKAGFEAIRRRLSDPIPAYSYERSTPPVMPTVSTAPLQSPIRSSTAAIVVEAYGAPDVMQFKQIPLEPPTAHEVRIRHTAIGVNYIDVYCRSGYFNLLNPPGTPGMEAAGVVEMVGQDVQGVSVGDRVAYACPPVGAYCEHRNMSPDFLVHLSPQVSDQMAAASLLKGVSASFLLHEVTRIRPGSTILVHAAAGGVGQLVVQWARHLGAEVIATASSEDKLQVAKRLGAHHTINYSQENFVNRVQQLTQDNGVDVVFDAVGADTFAGSLACLGVQGHLISFGQASGPIGSHDIGALAHKSITLSRPNYGHYTNTPEKLATHAQRFFNAVRDGVIHLENPTTYPLHAAAQAHRDLEARKTTGAIILIP